MRQTAKKGSKRPVRTRKKSMCSLIYLLFALLCASVWLAAVYALTETNRYSRQTNDTSATVARPESIAATNTEPNQTEVRNQPQEQLDVLAEEGSTIICLTYEQLVEINDGHLTLVNNEYAVGSDIPGKQSKVSDYVAALAGVGTMNSDALIMLKHMFEYAQSVGYTEFRVTQGFRTHEEQQTLYDSAPDKSFVAFPGNSEHQTGLAADISYSGLNIANSNQGTWLMENAHQFGFILRYPQHKTDITGFSFEPWHYRYVGQPHAYFIHENDYVLEEYIDRLKKQGDIPILYAGAEYTVYYVTEADEIEMSNIPQGQTFSVSADNTGGWIITVKHN